MPEGPGVVALRNVTHLGTRITGHLAERTGVGARSRRRVAPDGRGRRAAQRQPRCVAGRSTRASTAAVTPGPVGWVDAAGDGEWWVGIRCAEIDDNRAVLRAGCGIVAGSDPASELIESQLKLQALLAALVRP